MDLTNASRSRIGSPFKADSVSPMPLYSPGTEGMMMQEHFNKTGQNFVSRTQQKQYNTISAQMYQPRPKKVVMQSDVVKEKFGDPEAEEDGE